MAESEGGEASLPMYDLPELDDAHDALWSLVRARLARLGVAAPARLVHRPALPAAWLRPELVLSQTCGWPLVTMLRRQVTTLGTFRYRVPSAEGGTYRSRLVARRELRDARPAALAGATAAVNERSSLSGWVSLVAALGVDGRWPGPVVLTGSHLESVRALADGRAGIASIDAVTHELIQHRHPELVGELEVVGAGPRVPCLPLVSRGGLGRTEVAPMRTALAAAVAEPAAAPIRDALLIEAFVPMDLEDYDAALAALRHHVGATG